jgi:hypothetical protein
MLQKRKGLFILLILTTLTSTAHSQGVLLTEIIFLCKPDLKDGVQEKTFLTFLETTLGKKNNTKTQAQIEYHLFKADRGDDKEDLLLVSTTQKSDRFRASGNPFTDKTFTLKGSSQKLSDFATTGAYTAYQLIGADKFKTLPAAGILGIHYIKVKKEKATDFEKFVEAKMHPAVGNILPDMHLLTYKAVGGDHGGSYVTIFAITSVEARDKYWPAGKPETPVLKEAFYPHKDLAEALSVYLVEGSYLEPAGGAAAIFESKEWTDFIYQF